MNFPKVTFDTRRALTDFDGDADSIAEVLLAFLEDLDTGRTALEEVSASGRAAYAAVLHELANSLESIWCFDAGRRVREIERSCHFGEMLDTVMVQHEVTQLLEAAADRAREWLHERFS